MRWRILPLLMVFVALGHFNRISMSVVGTERLIEPRGSLSETQMGAVYSAYLLLYTLFMMPGGWFIDRFGPRRAWMIVGFGSAGFVALTGAVGLLFMGASLWGGLLGVRALLGISSAPLHPTAARLVGNWIPPSGASTANGLVTCAACLGIASTYLIIGWLIDELDWPKAFLICSVSTLIVAGLWTLLSADHPAEATPRPTPPLPRFSFRDQLHLLKNRSLLCITLSYAALGYFQYLFFYWSQHYFEKVEGVPQERSRLYSTILTLAMGGGMVLGGWLSDRAQSVLGPRRGLALSPILGFLLSAGGVLIGLRASDSEQVLVWFSVAMAGIGMCEGSFWTMAVMIGGSRGGTTGGIMNTGGNAGGLLSPVVTPLLSKYFEWQVGLQVAAVICLIGAVLWIAIDPADQVDQSRGDVE